jgi:uncharacterized protein YkwD
MRKPSRRAGLAAMGAVVAGVVPANAAEPPKAKEVPTPTDRMLTAVNELRLEHGLAPYRASPELSQSAARFAAWQMRAGRFGHLDLIRWDGRHRVLGEAISIHAGLRARVHVTLRGWARSQVHRPLLLSRRLREAGAGISSGRYGGRPTTIWVLQLGSRR